MGSDEEAFCPGWGGKSLGRAGSELRSSAAIRQEHRTSLRLAVTQGPQMLDPGRAPPEEVPWGIWKGGSEVPERETSARWGLLPAGTASPFAPTKRKRNPGGCRRGLGEWRWATGGEGTPGKAGPPVGRDRRDPQGRRGAPSKGEAPGEGDTPEGRRRRREAWRLGDGRQGL